MIHAALWLASALFLAACALSAFIFIVRILSYVIEAINLKEVGRAFGLFLLVASVVFIALLGLALLDH